MTPKFSIVIPVYNRPEYLRTAIASCLNQTVRREFEIIVSDDCSLEDLRRVTESFGDSRIKYYRSERRLGAARNHQHAVSLSSGVYVIALHSDDLLLPECLEKAGAALDLNPGAAAVYFACIHWSGSKVNGFSHVPILRFADRGTSRKNPWLEKFSGVNPSCCLFRRSPFDLIGGYRTSLKFAYDWEIYMRFMEVGGGVVFLSQVLSIYRQHDEQAIRTSRLDGLRDMLDLWKLEEYSSRFAAWEIAELVLTQCGVAFRNDSQISDVITEITSRHLTRRVLLGLPKALYAKVCRRIRNVVNIDPNYEKPLNLDEAMRSVMKIIADHP